MKVVLVLVLGAVILIFGGVIWFSRVVAIGAAIAAVVLANILYHSYFTAPDCGVDEVTMAVATQLSPKFSGQALDIRHIQTVSGGFFSSRNECLADVSPMGGFGEQSSQHWTRVSYSTYRAKGGDAAVDARIVGSVSTQTNTPAQ